jgi:hypothetical protein
VAAFVHCPSRTLHALVSGRAHEDHSDRALRFCSVVIGIAQAHQRAVRGTIVELNRDAAIAIQARL